MVVKPYHCKIDFVRVVNLCHQEQSFCQGISLLGTNHLEYHKHWCITHTFLVRLWVLNQRCTLSFSFWPTYFLDIDCQNNGCGSSYKCGFYMSIYGIIWPSKSDTRVYSSTSLPQKYVLALSVFFCAFKLDMGNQDVLCWQIEALGYSSCTLLCHDWGGCLGWSVWHLNHNMSLSKVWLNTVVLRFLFCPFQETSSFSSRTCWQAYSL